MGNLLPWYLRFWKAEVAIGAAVVVGIYITSLNQIIDNDQLMLEKSHDQLVRVTAEYKTDVQQMTNSIKSQNAMIEQLQKDTDNAKKQVALAEWQSTVVKQNADKQVNAILNRPTVKGCQPAINEAISTLPDLFWDKLQ